MVRNGGVWGGMKINLPTTTSLTSLDRSAWIGFDGRQRVRDEAWERGMTLRFDYCDECERYGQKPQTATWSFVVMGVTSKATARLLTCDRHAEWYRAKGDDIYPSERIGAAVTDPGRWAHLDEGADPEGRGAAETYVESIVERVGRGDWPAAVSDGLSLACSDCGQLPRFDYLVTSEFWEQWVPGPERLSVVCLPCLDHRCEGVGLAAAISKVQWTGTGHTVVLVPANRYEYDPTS